MTPFSSESTSTTTTTTTATTSGMTKNTLKQTQVNKRKKPIQSSTTSSDRINKRKITCSSRSDKKAPTPPPPPLPASTSTMTLSNSSTPLQSKVKPKTKTKSRTKSRTTTPPPSSSSSSPSSPSSSTAASHSYKTTKYNSNTTTTSATTNTTNTNINAIEANTTNNNSNDKDNNNDNDSNNTNSIATAAAATKHHLATHQLHASDIIHDTNYCMFKLSLDKAGNTAALCYLPTRFKHVVEFYHTEIPMKYRHCGLGDLLLHRAFQWAKSSNRLVIPTCPFVKSYLETRSFDQNSTSLACLVVANEQEGIERLSSPSPSSLSSINKQ